MKGSCSTAYACQRDSLIEGNITMAQSLLTYAGHSAFFVHMNGATIAIDPWLQGNPRCPEDLKNPKALDLIVLSHGHSDHASDAVRLAKQTGAAVAATWELAMIMIKEGVAQEKVMPMNKGGTIDHQGIKITLTNAFHSSSYDTQHGPVYAGEACGIVLQDGSQTIYHAGDTALFADMALIGSTYKPSIALLPIGDRFTMGPKEAAQAAGIVGAEVNIPMHFKTFDVLTGTAEEFGAACKSVGNLKARELEPGQAL